MRRLDAEWPASRYYSVGRTCVFRKIESSFHRLAWSSLGLRDLHFVDPLSSAVPYLPKFPCSEAVHSEVTASLLEHVLLISWVMVAVISQSEIAAQDLCIGILSFYTIYNLPPTKLHGAER